MSEIGKHCLTATCAFMKKRNCGCSCSPCTLARAQDPRLAEKKDCGLRTLACGCEVVGFMPPGCQCPNHPEVTR